MSLFIFLAGFALLAKSWLIFDGITKPWADRRWLWLVFSYAALNAAEMSVYISAASKIEPTYLIKCYFLCTLICIASSYDYIIDNSNKIQRWTSIIIYFLAVAISLFLTFTDSIVGGYVSGSMPIQSSKGEFFPVYIGFVIPIVLLTMVTLCVNYRRSKTSYERVNYAYVIIAMTPVALVIVSVLSLMVVGYEANSSGLIPLATTAFLWISCKGKVSSNISTDPRSIVEPLSFLAKNNREVAKAKTQFMLGNASYSETVSKIETAIIDSLIAEHDGNISKASRASGVDRAMIYRKRTKA